MSYLSFNILYSGDDQLTALAHPLFTRINKNFLEKLLNNFNLQLLLFPIIDILVRL